MGLSGAALQKEVAESTCNSSKGAVGTWRDPLDSRQLRLKPLCKSLGRQDLLGPAEDMGAAGTDCVVPPAWVHILHLSPMTCVTLSALLKLCRFVCLPVRLES